jgi:hypothetical protein
MKTSSDPGARQPLSRAKAMNCLLVNQFATPGLGSLMARRFLAGSAQLAIFLAGFFCMIGWFIQRSIDTYRMVNDLPEQPSRYPWLGFCAYGLAAAGWLMAWITSLSLLREARRNEANLPPGASPPPKIPVPPRIP